jgi:hypothetical protein
MWIVHIYSTRSHTNLRSPSHQARSMVRTCTGENLTTQEVKKTSVVLMNYSAHGDLPAVDRRSHDDAAAAATPDDDRRRPLLGHLPLDRLHDARELAGVAWQLERPVRREVVAVRLLRLLQQRPEQAVVHALGPDDEPLPRLADVHGQAALRRRLPTACLLIERQPPGQPLPHPSLSSVHAQTY